MCAWQFYSVLWKAQGASPDQCPEVVLSRYWSSDFETIFGQVLIFNTVFDTSNRGSFVEGVGARGVEIALKSRGSFVDGGGGAWDGAEVPLKFFFLFFFLVDCRDCVSARSFTKSPNSIVSCVYNWKWTSLSEPFTRTDLCRLSCLFPGAARPHRLQVRSAWSYRERLLRAGPEVFGPQKQWTCSHQDDTE